MDRTQLETKKRYFEMMEKDPLYSDLTVISVREAAEFFDLPEDALEIVAKGRFCPFSIHAESGKPLIIREFLHRYMMERSGMTEKDMLTFNHGRISTEELLNGMSIVRNTEKRAVTVKWGDGSITVVKASPDEEWDDYAAFTAAFAKRLIGNNSRIHHYVGMMSDLKKTSGK